MSSRRYNSGKMKLHLIPEAMKELAEVYTKGAEKYTIYEKDGVRLNGNQVLALPKDQQEGWSIVSSGEDNWKLGQDYMSSLGSILRHIEAFKLGEDIDPDLGTHHLANAAWGCLALIEYSRIHPEKDNRSLWWKRPLKRVWFDIDGVLADFEKAFLYKFGYDKNDHSTDWNDPRFRLNYDKLEGDNQFWLDIPPIIKPEQISYPIAGYCTARTCPDEITLQWLRNNGFPEAQFKNVGRGSKAGFLKGKCDVFVDDSINHFVDLNSNDILCMLMTRPHNTKYDVGTMRVSNMNEFMTRVKKLL